jgi:hypothetical protein
MSNLTLWDSVSRTDPKYTKTAKKGQYQFTAIAPVSQFKEATNAFGIQGIGWGVVVGSEKFTKETFEETILLTYDAVLFFTYNGVRGEIPIHAQEKACYRTQGANGYLKIDDEARKKVVTNAKTKGLSELGFNADIFMGMFDDSEYRDLIEAELRLEGAANFEAEQEEMFKEFNAWLKVQCESMSLIPNESSVVGVINRHETTLRDKLKVMKASPAKIEASLKKLYAYGDKQIAAIKLKNQPNKSE